MEVVVEFTKSAFRHGISTLKTKVHASAINAFPEKYVVIGFDRAGNPLEVMYNPIDANTINVFHAMKVRKSFIVQLNL
ncbi:hypothetical protein AGMMS49942_25130 [Spirochaetia bacterium]|nr:hypothetical protein AGMMS49942_25130 [Spirochaetia bacterium]